MSKKFSLSPSPTFKRKVSIPVSGGRPVDIEVTFKHKTRDQFKEFIDNLNGKEDVELLQEIACGWDLEDEFGKESLEMLVQNFMGSAKAIFDVYVSELTGARLGN